MKNTKEHLNIDLDFLDEEELAEVTSQQESSIPKEPNWRYYNANRAKANLDSKGKYSWKSILIGGVILFFIWAMLSDDNSSINNNANNYKISDVKKLTSDDNSYIIGKYRCLKNDYDKAVKLAPSETEQQLEAVRRDLEYKSNELDRLESEIDDLYVNEYSPQYKIDQYNAKVTEYNAKLISYKQDVKNFNSRIERYNAQVEIYNKYLENHCIPISR